MNIAILGASFDPAHNGHLTIAKNVLRSQSQRVNKVILMPVNIHPFAKQLTQAKHRFAMTKLLERKNIEVSDLEIKKNSTSYSIDTLKALKKKFQKNKFYWIIGYDYLDSFTKWKDWKKILSDFGLIIVARNINTNISNAIKKFINDKNLNKNIIILNEKDFPLIDVSSSQIKKMIKEKKSISNLVPKKIEEYIIQNKLYE